MSQVIQGLELHSPEAVGCHVYTQTEEFSKPYWQGYFRYPALALRWIEKRKQQWPAVKTYQVLPMFEDCLLPVQGTAPRPRMDISYLVEPEFGRYLMLP